MGDGEDGNGEDGDGEDDEEDGEEEDGEEEEYYEEEEEEEELEEDDPRFRFRNQSFKDCNWVARRPRIRCGRSWKGMSVYDYCPVSCASFWLYFIGSPSQAKL